MDKGRPFLHCHHRFKNGKDHCYSSIVEQVRTQRGWVQRPLLYWGEINDCQQAAWTKLTEVFDPFGQQTQALALYPADRAVPEHAAHHGVQVRLAEFSLRRLRQWDACWVGCRMWEQLRLDEFWRARLPDWREGTCWRQVLATLTIYRLIDPGGEWRLHRPWFHHSALAEMRASDPPVHDLVGTPKGRLGQYEAQLLELPWQAVRDGVQVKLPPREGELYVLAQSQDRVDKERAMRQRQLKGLVKRLKELAGMELTRDQLLLKLGAAKNQFPAAWRLLTLPVPEQAEALSDFKWTLRRDKLRQVRRREGRYLLRSHLSAQTPEKLWQL